MSVVHPGQKHELSLLGHASRESCNDGSIGVEQVVAGHACQKGSTQKEESTPNNNHLACGERQQG
jgi:hypothetical protein